MSSLPDVGGSWAAGLQALLDHEVLPEIGAPLPLALHQARELGLANMLRVTSARGG